MLYDAWRFVVDMNVNVPYHGAVLQSCYLQLLYMQLCPMGYTI